MSELEDKWPTVGELTPDAINHEVVVKTGDSVIVGLLEELHMTSEAVDFLAWGEGEYFPHVAQKIRTKIHMNVSGIHFDASPDDEAMVVA